MRLSRSNTVLLVFVLTAISAGLTACASGSGSSGPRRDPNMITAEELAEYSNYNALDIIRRIRPNWLRTRGTAGPQVIMDGARMGETEALNTISANDIESMRLLSATDATMRFGTNFTGGAIEVISRGR